MVPSLSGRFSRYLCAPLKVPLSVAGRKMHLRIVIIQVVLAGVFTVRGAHVAPERVKRGIFGTVTSTVYKAVEQKHYVPASCVHVSPNLPDCRNPRFMNYPSFDSNSFKFLNIGNELFPPGATKRVDNGVTTIQGWGEYLGFYRPTVTVTEVKIEPTTVVDPRIIVTYDIRGCKPHQLPFNLEKCPEENSLELAEILPTTTVRGDIKATSLPEKRGGVVPEDLLYGSETSGDQEIVHSATKSLM